MRCSTYERMDIYKARMPERQESKQVRREMGDKTGGKNGNFKGSQDQKQRETASQALETRETGNLKADTLSDTHAKTLLESIHNPTSSCLWSKRCLETWVHLDW